MSFFKGAIWSSINVFHGLWRNAKMGYPSQIGTCGGSGGVRFVIGVPPEIIP